MITDTHTTTDQTPDQTPETTDAHHDRHGNRILSARGLLGQYRIVSARSGEDGRVLRVCGEAATKKHLPLWEYHAGERRYVCTLCFPEARETRETTDEEESEMTPHV